MRIRLAALNIFLSLEGKNDEAEAGKTTNLWQNMFSRCFLTLTESEKVDKPTFHLNHRYNDDKSTLVNLALSTRIDQTSRT